MDLGRHFFKHTRQHPCILNHSLEINFCWNTLQLHSYVLLHSSSFVCFLCVMYHLQKQFFLPALFHMTLLKFHALIDVIVHWHAYLVALFMFFFQKRLHISTKEIKRRSELPNQMKGNVSFHEILPFISQFEISFPFGDQS
jgi:hypothetical protein